MQQQLLAELGSEDDSIRRRAIDEARQLSPFHLTLLIEHYFALHAKSDPKRQARWWDLPGQLRRVALLNTSEDSVSTPRQRASAGLAQILGEVTDVTYVGSLLTALARRSPAGGDWKIAGACQAALSRLLPEIQPEHTTQWTDAQRKQLLHSLEIVRRNYPEIDTLRDQMNRSSFPHHSISLFRFNLRIVREPALNVLKLLQRIGDERELRLVGYIANIKPRTPIAREIQRAAEECLPFIQRRAHENQQAKTLLRASNSCASPLDELLRPAADCGEIAANELLRPEPGHKLP